MNRDQKNRLFMTIGIIGALLLIYASLQIFANTRFLEYQSADGFSINYPAQWYINPEKIQGVSVIFHSPANSKLDDFSENVNVVVQNLEGQGMSLRKYSDMAVLQVKAVFKSGITILEDEPTRLGNKPAHKMTFVSRGEDIDVQMMMIWTVSDGKSYQVSYTATAETYNDYLDKVEKMIQSFKIN